MKIKPCLDEYLEYLAVHRHLSPLTVAANRRDLEHFIQALPEQKTHSIATIKELEIRTYLMQRSAAKSLARYRSHLKNFFAYCLQQYPERLDSNPVELVSTPKIKRTLPEVLDVDTLFKLLDIPANSEIAIRDKALLELFYSSGLRLSELAGIQWHDLLIDEGMVRVLGKGNKERLIPLGQMAKQALLRW